jgi:hypothetical protein
MQIHEAPFLEQNFGSNRRIVHLSATQQQMMHVCKAYTLYVASFKEQYCTCPLFHTDEHLISRVGIFCNGIEMTLRQSITRKHGFRFNGSKA